MINEFVSVIVPIYNESNYIQNCIESIINQDYPKNLLEVLFIDGNSNDSTIDIIKSYNISYFKILYNPNRIVTHALNIGIQNSKGEFIVRMDAHAKYESSYIRLCINTIKETNAENVGGIAITDGIGKIGKANAEILSSRFGVGNSQFRISTKSGYVDTVPFGTFRKETFDRIGFFDLDLPRSEDNDINSRIRQNGGRVYLNAKIKFTYYCRNTFGGLLNQALKNGNALFLTLRKNKKAMSVRHFIPFLFLLSIIILPILSIWIFPIIYLFAIEMILYFTLDVFFSLKGNKKYFLYKFFTYFLFHIFYGVGSLIGLINIKMY